MACAEYAAAFLDDDTRAVPPQAIDLLSALSNTSLKSLASAAVSELTETSTTEPHPQVDNEAFAAMCVIVASFAKNGGAQRPAEQRQQLYALGVEDDELQEKLLSVLTTVAPRVEHVLENTYFDFAHVVDVKWRLDYVLRSSCAGSIHEPLYFVELRLQSPCVRTSSLQSMAFTCSVEELRSLVYRIQEASNRIEKLAAGTTSSIR